jgi:ABC-type transport system involved in cytochrome bd biosynthesis fused ATPase/permease subunit
MNFFDISLFFYRREGRRFGLLVAFGILLALFDTLGILLFLPLLSSLNEAASSQDFISQGLIFLGLKPNPQTVLPLMVLIFSAKAIMRNFIERKRVRYQQQLMREMRVEAVQSVAQMPYQTFVKQDVGALQNILGSEVNRSNMAYSYCLQAWQFFIMAGFFFCVALFMHPGFALVVGALSFLSHLAFQSLHKKAATISQEVTSLHHYFHRLMLQMVRYFPYLRVTSREMDFSTQLENTSRQMEDKQEEAGRVSAWVSSIREPIVLAISVGALLLFHLWFEKGLAESLVVFIIMYRSAQFTVDGQSQLNGAITLGASVTSLSGFLKKHTYELRKSHSSEEIKVAGIRALDLVVSDVAMPLRFSWSAPGLYILSGASGQGKTSLLRCISGVQQPISGEVYCYDENDEKLLNPAVGYVAQEGVVFSDTVRNNLSFWNTKLFVDEDYWNILSKLGLEKWVREMPDALDTFIDPRSVSGGEAQRLSFAREYLLRRPIVLLDEPTSALDKNHREKVVQLIEDWSQTAIVVVVTHQPELFSKGEKLQLG